MMINPHDEYHQTIVDAISFYPKKRIQSDKTVTTVLIPTPFFLDNDKWHISFFAGFDQFRETVEKYLENCRSTRNLLFELKNANMNNELKYIVHSKIFSEEWSIKPTYGFQTSHIRKYALFINEFYPDINSLLELDVERVHHEWIEWLRGRSVPIERQHRYYVKDGQSLDYTHVAAFLRSIYRYLFGLVDTRDEWEKDIWDVKNLRRYGIEYNRSITPGYVNFSKINNFSFRAQCKKFMKAKLLGKSYCSWRTAVNSVSYISRFLNCVTEMEPSWETLKKLKRCHVEKYIEYLNQYASSIRRDDSNPKDHVYRSISIISRFLSELQIYGYDLAPEKNVLSLIFPYDRPTVPKKPYDQIDYIIAAGNLRIYPKAYKVSVRDKEVKLTGREFELLLFLAENPNIVFSKEKLFEKIWGYDYVGDSATVTVHINHVREKIEDDSSNPQYIETVWGAGYRFNKQAE